jgi:patatin-like phospholipase/acyl hydrolase
MKKVRILSLDGGGMRGIIPATVLEYVENKIIEITKNPNARLADYFDMVAGTSTGGILSGFYLTPSKTLFKEDPISKYKASEALDFYSKDGYKIFNESKKFGWFGLRQLFNAAQYSPKELERILHREFRHLHLKELLKPCIITTYNLQSKNSFFFSSREPINKDRAFYLKDVLRSTSAAPTYFPPAFIKNISTQKEMINIDGGVFANNPAMCAYSEARATDFGDISFPGAKDILVLSIGTGGGQFDLPNVKKSSNWGILPWATSIPDIMMDGSIDTVDYQMKNIFDTLNQKDKFNYKRVDVPKGKRTYSSDMADASPENVEALKKAGIEALKAAQTKGENEYTLDEFIYQLIENN